MNNRLKYMFAPRAWPGWARKNLRHGQLRVRRATGRIPQAPLCGAEALPEDIRAGVLELSLRECSPPSMLAEPCAFGGEHQRARLRAVAAFCLDHFPGDLIEIGCFIGETTRVLAELARSRGRRVIAVDPWETGTQNCTGDEYERFCANIKEYGDSVDILRLSSLSPEARRQVKARPLAMAYVDGLHTYEAARTDIQTVSHCAGIVAVDDVSYGFEVMLAMRHAAHDLRRISVHLAPAKEGYLVFPLR